MGKEKIGDIRKEMLAANECSLPAFIAEYQSDAREGVQKIVHLAEKKIENLNREKERIWKLTEYERSYQEKGFICGIDEVGRGPLAGPVVAAAVILPPGAQIMYINDSKKLSAARREELYEIIIREAVSYGIGMITPQRIDEINILQATYEAMRQAIEQLTTKPAVLLNDAVTIPEVSIPQVPIIKGDAKSISIGAASIIAKVTRDRLMEEYDKIMPEYGFASNKGYGSQAHIQALKKYGPCVIHRKSFIGHFVDVCSES